jgi:hypothetical protein
VRFELTKTVLFAGFSAFAPPQNRVASDQQPESRGRAQRGIFAEPRWSFFVPLANISKDGMPSIHFDAPTGSTVPSGIQDLP